MPNISFLGKTYACDSTVSLLDNLNSQGANISYGCRGGLCQACMLKAVAGEAPELAKQGIKPTLLEKGYFLSCICKPVEDMEITLPDRRDEFHHSLIIEKSHLNDSVIRLRLQCPDGFNYRPGQFINLIRPEDGLSRSYSIASIHTDEILELHIKVMPDGRLSNWISDHLQINDEILLSDPMGNCCYGSHCSDAPLLLAGTGTGLAPLYGVLRDALNAGHQQPITLLHGVLDRASLYYADELNQLAASHKNFSYITSVKNEKAPEGGLQGPIDQSLKQLLTQFNNAQSFLCGDSNSVDVMRQVCLQHGLFESDIHADAFG